MALTFSTGLTSIDAADATTNWAPYKLTAGGATPSVVSVTDLKKEGTACNGIKPTSNKDCGMVFDYYAANTNTVLNMETSGNEVIAFWLRSLFSGQVLTQASGGLYLIICAGNGIPGGTTNWAKWYIGGSDDNPDGWTWYQVDTRKAPSASGAGWTAGPAGSLSTVYRIGVGAYASSATAARVENFLVDEMWYGWPTYKVTGDGTTVCDWSDFLGDSVTNVTGLIEDINGSLQMACGVQIGDDAQSSTTTFDDDTNQALNWKRFTYHNGTSIVDSLNYSDYYIFNTAGAASFNTSFTLGNIVGTEAGIVGGTIKSLDPTNVPLEIDFSTDSAHMSAMNLYGVTFSDVTGPIALGNDASYDVFSCQWVGCTQVDPVGACVIRNNLFINTADVDAALLWQSNIDIADCQFIANTVGAAIEITETVDQDYDNLLFSGNTDDTLLNNGTPGTAIDVSKSNGSNPTTYENFAGNTAILTYVGAAATLTVTVYDGSVSPPALITDLSVNVIVEAAAGGPLTAGDDIIKGFSNVSGVIADTRVWASDQPITGWARRSSSANTPLASGYNLFKTFPIAGTINSASGANITVLLQPDE